MEIPRDTSITRRSVLRTVGLGLLTLGGISNSAVAQQRGNGKNNGNGGHVTGMYKATYAYDATNNWYGYNMSNRDLEDGSVSSIDELDQETLTTCYYKNQYAGDFGDDPYLDMGWISNHVVCKGYEPDTQNVLFVHETDPRYTGARPVAFGGGWEYHVTTKRGEGNTLITDDVRPHNHR